MFGVNKFVYISGIEITKTTIKMNYQINNTSVNAEYKVINEVSVLDAVTAYTNERAIYATKLVDGNWFITLKKVELEVEGALYDKETTLRSYRMNDGEFFAYFDKKIAEWK
jgi:hypothetical protein